MKKIISLILVVATLFAALTVNVGAARAEEFISEVALVYKDSVAEAKKAIEGTDWKLFEQDLNANADAWIDDGVYLIYKTTTDVEEAITDLRIMDMYGGYSSSNYDKQLEASRKAYMQAVSYIRITAAEFKALYVAGDEMAKIAYRQMNYYKDSNTNLLMGDFMLNIPSDEALVTVLLEGNGYAVTNLISLLAVGISGGSDKTLAERISEKFAIKDTLSDGYYYDATSKLADEFKEFSACVRRYNALADQYDLTDEDMSDEEAEFLLEYATIALILEQIPYGEETLKDFLARDDWQIKDLYPIVAALSEGQLALTDIGVFTTVLQYSSPSASIERLYEALEETEKELTDENGNLRVFDVYTGVDRSIFEGDFAFTTAAERQQALTGMEWSATQSSNDAVPYEQIKAMTIAGASLAVGPIVAVKILKTLIMAFGWGGNSGTVLNSFGTVGAKVLSFLLGTTKDGALLGIGKGGLTKFGLIAGVGILMVAIGVTSIAAVYGYYNSEYTPIPNTMVDVRETDLGDKYIKYTAAKVFENGKLSEKNADFNAYQGKEWNALYYTKDATAGNCLTPNFVFSDSSSAVTRRHQGVSMFGETNAFNLNSHVFNSSAKGAYLTVRYSTAKKTAAEVPAVVGSIFATGALYMVTALGGAAVGIGGTLLLQKAKKKKDEVEPEAAE